MHSAWTDEMAARAGTDCSGQMIASCFYWREKMTGNTQRAVPGTPLAG